MDKHKLLLASLAVAGLLAPSFAQEFRAVETAGVTAGAFDSTRQRLVAVGRYGETLELIAGDWRTRPIPRLAIGGLDFVRLAHDQIGGLTYMAQSPVILSSGSVQLSTFDGMQWQPLNPSGGPPHRAAFALAFDRARGELLLFGGFVAPGYIAGDTWVFDGNSWTQRIPAVSPSDRHSVGVAYDAARARVVMFGGRTGAFTRSDETWEWDGSAWSQAAPTVIPPARDVAALTFDPLRARIVMFGGQQQSNVLLDDIWEFDGVNWQSPGIVNPQPDARVPAVFAFDEVSGRCVLAGGDNAHQLHDTWAWNGNVWTRIANPLRPSHFPHTATAATPTGDVVMLEAPYVAAPRCLLWNGQNWSPMAGVTPPSLPDNAATTGPAYAYVFCPNGQAPSASELWGFDGVAWSLLSSTGPALSFAAITYDWGRGELLLFGGLASNSSVNETWVFDGTNWLRRTPPVSPPARYDAVLGYDLARQRAVLYGGIFGSVYLRDTWEWDGVNWSQVATLNPPPAGVGSMGFDIQRGELRMVVTNYGTLGDATWTFDGTDWTSHALADVPPKHYIDSTLITMASPAGHLPRQLLLFDADSVSALNEASAEVDYSGQACTNSALAITVREW
ncbi:MAG: hypothetical protein KDC98_04665, partial [Planctomycetes bacterium]|nr:hypothetical protein [Planctomycetota bacterium]